MKKEKPFMRKILSLLLLLTVPVLLPGTAAAAMSDRNGLSFDRIENWDYILSRLDSQITRADQILSSYQSSREFDAANADFSKRIYMQADELRFLLSVSAPQNVFEITLRCQQIDDLYVIFRRRYDVLNTIRNASAELTARTETVRSELDQMSSRPQFHRYEERIREVTAKYQAFRDKSNKITSELERSLDPELETMMEELVKEAAQARTETIDQAFFSRQTTFWQLLPGMKQIMQYWYYTSMDAKHFGGSGLTRGDYLTFFAIFLPLLLVFLVAGPRRLYPWLLKQTRFPDMYRKSKLFFVAGILLVLACSLYLFQFRTELNYSSQVHQLSQTFGALALLFLALAFRMDRPAMRRCLGLYLPFIFQSLGANVLFTLVMPYQPLMLISVPLNVFCMFWALLMLRRRGYPVFDLVIVWSAIAVVAVETVLMAWGFLYIGFTMMLTGFIVLGLFEAAIAASRIIFNRIAEHPEARMSNIFLRHLVFPVIWLGGIAIIVGNISSTYYLGGWLSHWAGVQFNVHNFLSFSVNDLVTVIVVLFILLFLVMLAKYFILNAFESSRDRGMVLSFVTLGNYIVWALFAVFVLLVLEVQYSSVLVILGGFSVGFGFALKEVLENFISGIILLVGQQVRPGDEIEFDGIYAKVRAVSFRATVIETFDGSVITLPNTNVLSKDFRNWTRMGSRMRRDLHIGVAYDSDLKLVRQTLLDAAAALPSIYRQPVPEVYCSEFQESAIDFTLRVWVRTGAQVIVLSALREKVAELFEERGISIPFNQLDVRLVDVPPVPPATCGEAGSDGN